MAVRPPQQSSGDPESIEFGIAALDDRLENADMTFPADRDEIVSSIAENGIPIDASGRTVDLETVLDEADAERFESEQELLNVLHPIFERHREQSATGIVSSIRSLLPF